MLDFAPTSLMTVMGEKLEGTHISVSQRVVDWDENPFSREQWPCSTLLMTT
jgi:hypothetical protein